MMFYEQIPGVPRFKNQLYIEVSDAAKEMNVSEFAIRKLMKSSVWENKWYGGLTALNGELKYYIYEHNKSELKAECGQIDLLRELRQNKNG